MRLLRTSVNPQQGSLEVVFFAAVVPTYAILSHTWATISSEEITLQDVQNGNGSLKPGYIKVLHAMNLARHDGFEWIWIDTCCIDKTSSVELSEAINSMFAYYKHAAKCYAFLADVSEDDFAVDFPASRWFRRGWTLQELLAPSEVVFISKDWKYIGTKITLDQAISDVTGVDDVFLTGKRDITTASIAKRMSWASNREVTREEDIAYCLIGIFSVNMFMLYGEGGGRAFARLQEEIIRTSEDQSIFAWSKPEGQGGTLHGMLADHPKDFERAGRIMAYSSTSRNLLATTMTSKGLHITLPLTATTGDKVIAALHCPCPTQGFENYIAIYLVRHSSAANSFARIDSDKQVWTEGIGTPQTIFVIQNIPEIGKEEVYPNHLFSIESMKVHTNSPELKNYTVDETYLDGWRGNTAYNKSAAGERSWASAPLTHRVVKKAGAVSAALRVTRKSDGAAFVLLLGSITDFGVGYDVSYDTPGSRETKDTAQWREYWQARFHPQQAGTYLPVDRPSIRVVQREAVVEDYKWFYLTIEIDPLPSTSMPANGVTTMSPKILEQQNGKPGFLKVWKKSSNSKSTTSLRA